MHFADALILSARLVVHSRDDTNTDSHARAGLSRLIRWLARSEFIWTPSESCIYWHLLVAADLVAGVVGYRLSVICSSNTTVVGRAPSIGSPSKPGGNEWMNLIWQPWTYFQFWAANQPTKWLPFTPNPISFLCTTMVFQWCLDRGIEFRLWKPRVWWGWAWGVSVSMSMEVRVRLGPWLRLRLD